MNPLLWIVFGALVGWLAVILAGPLGVRRAHKYVTIAVIGAVMSGFAAIAILNEPLLGFSIYTILAAVAGASFIIWLCQNQME